MLTQQEKSKTLSVLLVEDDLHFRAGIRNLLEFCNIQDQTISVVGEANRPTLAMSLATQHSPDLILLDMELSEDNSFAFLQQIQEHDVSSKILVISGHQEETWIYQAMQAGADGYVFKSQVADQLLGAIQAVLQDQIYLPTEVATGFFRRFQKTQIALPIQTEQLSELSEREKDVLRCLVQGASNDEIAKQLYISVATVKAHITNIFLKLQVTSRTQAIVVAIKMNLV
jgi:DNA-binding NarL/FixJ family response regulator